LQTRLEDLSKEQLNRLIIQQVLGGICELHEYLEKGTAWKDHRAVETIDHEAALEELVDVMKYVLNIFIYADVSLEEFAEAWNKKTQLVEARFNREFTTTASPSQVEHKTGGAQHGD
jgi:NTP pyrophosphatase (non-canonical NTP hydrolase)